MGCSTSGSFITVLCFECGLVVPRGLDCLKAAFFRDPVNVLSGSGCFSESKLLEGLIVRRLLVSFFFGNRGCLSSRSFSKGYETHRVDASLSV